MSRLKRRVLLSSSLFGVAPGDTTIYAVQSRRRALVPCDDARSVRAELRGSPMNRKFPAVICMVAAALGALSSCSRGNVDAKTNDAPATAVERAPDLNLVSVENPERFPLVTVASRREADQLTANGIVAPDVSRTVPVNALSSGRVANISKLLDPNTRTAKVRIELSNAKGILRPNMFAVVHFVSQGFQSRAVVPASAVLRLQDRDWVFIKLSENQFRRTEVQAGPAHPDGMQQILTGVRAGDQVVANALQFDREARKD